MFNVQNVKTKQVIPAILMAYPVYNAFIRKDYKTAALLGAPSALALLSPGFTQPGGEKADGITSLVTNVSLVEGAAIAAAGYGTYSLYQTGAKGEAMLAGLATLCMLFLGSNSSDKVPFNDVAA